MMTRGQFLRRGLRTEANPLYRGLRIEANSRLAANSCFCLSYPHVIHMLSTSTEVTYIMYIPQYYSFLPSNYQKKKVATPLNTSHHL